jgi:hypothetical protein
MKRCTVAILMVIVLMFFGGCAHHNLIEADEQMVKNCKFVGTFQSSYHRTSEAAKFAADQAYEKGATHVIIGPPIVQDSFRGGNQYLVQVKGYKCNTGTGVSGAKTSDTKTKNKPASLTTVKTAPKAKSKVKTETKEKTTVKTENSKKGALLTY